MILNIQSEWMDALFLAGLWQKDIIKQYKTYNIHPSEIILMAWSIHKIKKSCHAFIVTDRKIRFGSMLKNLVQTMDFSDIISVKYDGKYCMNFQLISTNPNSISIPASFFFKGTRYGFLSQEQQCFMNYLANILNVMAQK